MIVPGSANPLLMAGDKPRVVTACKGYPPDNDYFIKNSLRFRGSARPALSHAATIPAGSSYSFWLKRGLLNTAQNIVGSVIHFNANNTLTAFNHTTTRTFHDPTAWYHIQVSNNGLFVNGVSEGAVSTAAIASPTIGSTFDGYIADFICVDTAHPATDFGRMDPLIAVWLAKGYSGPFGATGFWLKFDDPAQIGKDSSGNNNHWSQSGFDLAAPGTQRTYDWMKDSPVMFDDGTPNPPGNYATLNSADWWNGSGTFSDANLVWRSQDDGRKCMSTLSVSTPGKWYSEFTVFQKGGHIHLGIYETAENWDPRFHWRDDGDVVLSGGGSKPNLGNYAQNDVIGLAYDATTGHMSFYKNGVLKGSGTAQNWQTVHYHFCATGGSTGQSTVAANFGQHPWAYPPPAGYKGLCTTSMAYCDPFTKPDGTGAHNVSVNVNQDRFKYLGYAPTASSGGAWGSSLDRFATGVRARRGGTYSITNSGERIKTGLAQGNP